MKRLMVAGVTALVMSGISMMVYAFCHDDYDCEEVITNVAGHYRWAPGNTNVRYLINNTTERGADDPEMTVDVKEAAKRWSRMEFEGETNPLYFTFDGITTNKYCDRLGDGNNVVGYHCLGQPEDEANPGECRRRVRNNYLVEMDILINPYYDWDLHGKTSSTEFCLLNTLVHEFGHAGGLYDVWYNPNLRSGRGNCPAWVDYTMHTGTNANQHDQADIACEDKYALMYMYGVLAEEDD